MALSLIAFPWALFSCSDNGAAIYDGPAFQQQNVFFSASGSSDSGLETDSGAVVYYADELILTLFDGSRKVFQNVYYWRENGVLWTSHNMSRRLEAPYTYSVVGCPSGDCFYIGNTLYYCSNIGVGGSVSSDSGFKAYMVTTFSVSGSAKLTVLGRRYTAMDGSPSGWVCRLECNERPSHFTTSECYYKDASGGWVHVPENRNPFP